VQAEYQRDPFGVVACGRGTLVDLRQPLTAGRRGDATVTRPCEASGGREHFGADVNSYATCSEGVHAPRDAQLAGPPPTEKGPVSGIDTGSGVAVSDPSDSFE
jgi:hypothetical protein